MQRTCAWPHLALAPSMMEASLTTPPVILLPPVWGLLCCLLYHLCGLGQGGAAELWCSKWALQVGNIKKCRVRAASPSLLWAISPGVKCDPGCCQEWCSAWGLGAIGVSGAGTLEQQDTVLFQRLRPMMPCQSFGAGATSIGCT